MILSDAMSVMAFIMAPTAPHGFDPGQELVFAPRCSSLPHEREHAGIVRKTL
ncbi:MAG: hypothetical protein QM741_10755 [Rudaea sp.]|uniref:hypothetical protein n=1 Tax=Rudaea sp. TaxID=2136325 RepID=UPI0039E5ADB0